jgi:hypothetical protein
MGRTI